MSRAFTPMLTEKETIDMSAFPVQPMSRTSIRAVLISGAGPVGLAGATALLEQLPELRSPIIVSLRDADLTRLHSRIGSTTTRWATDGASLDDASVWIAPSDRHTYVRDGRFELSGADSTSPADTPSLGKLYHSLRVEFGSRVFAVVIDETDRNSPSLRLLAGRGAQVVSPLDCGPDDIAQHWSTGRIATHLGDALAVATYETAGLA